MIRSHEKAKKAKESKIEVVKTIKDLASTFHNEANKLVLKTKDWKANEVNLNEYIQIHLGMEEKQTYRPGSVSLR